LKILINLTPKKIKNANIIGRTAYSRALANLDEQEEDMLYSILLY